MGRKKTSEKKHVGSPADSPAVQRAFERFKALSPEERQQLMKDKDSRSYDFCPWATSRELAD